MNSKVDGLDVPELRFSEFVGRWVSCDLADAASIFDGTHQTPTYTKEGVKFISVENIDDIGGSSKYISRESYNRDFKIKIRRGDILMTRITAGIIGATALVKSDESYAYYVSLALIRPNLSFDSSFLEKYIRTDQFKRELHKRIIHVAFPKKINLGDIGKCRISAPARPEQEAIAAFFDALDSREKVFSELVKSLNAYRKGMTQRLFSQELRFRRADGSSFSDWHEKQLGEVATIRKGEQLNRDAMTDDGEFPVINGGVTPSGHTNESNAEADTLTISEGGNSCGHVAWQSRPFWLGGHCYALTSKTAALGERFLFQLLKSRQSEIMRLRVGSGLPNIQKGDLTKFALALPHPDEQQRIADFLTAIDAKIEAVTKKIAATQRFKKAMLQRMFV